MRRLILILAMLCATLGAFAYTDSFTSMTHDPTFLALLDVVKNDGTEAEAQAAYEAYIATGPSMLDASRANYHMVRYYMDKGRPHLFRVLHHRQHGNGHGQQQAHKGTLQGLP